MTYPTACQICTQARLLGDEVLTLKAKPWRGENPAIFLLWQDPTLSFREIEVVFELDSPNSELRKFVEKILKPLGKSIEDIYATNTIKCTISILQNPFSEGKEKNQRARVEKRAKEERLTLEGFLRPFFENCKGYLEQELLNNTTETLARLWPAST